MGTIAVFHCPAPEASNLADHTYVRCGGGGKAWKCWGAKTGGSSLRRATGSTRRADAIAGPEEHGGITCYLINGVCHQAANRILLPARITVRGARGYGVSEALFGTYGRPRGILGVCQAPFRQHSAVNGDHSRCRGGRTGAPSSPEGNGQEAAYLRRVLAVYRKARAVLASTSEFDLPEWLGFQSELFLLQAEHRLGRHLDRKLSVLLGHARASAEDERYPIERAFVEKEIPAREFADAIDQMAIRFQMRSAEALTQDQYQALFDANPGDEITLADPEIVKTAWR